MSRFAFCAALLGMLLGAVPCSAEVEGSACGDLAILYTSQFGYGYSTYTMAWNTTLLAGTPVKHACSPSLGLLITTQRLYVFNALSGQWFSRSYSGTLQGFDIDGSVVVLWTDTACYAISSIWTMWATMSLLPGETVVGGGSCSTFGMIWTTHRALAYRASQNNCSTHDLDLPPLGGLAANGLGLVYSPSDVHVFEANPGDWIELDLEGSPVGLSTTGCGDVALVWSDLQA